MESFENLTVENATVALERGLEAIKNGQTVFDLSCIHTADSSAVAVLLAWQRAARKNGANLAFTNMPDSLKGLTSLYGVDDLLVDSPANLQHH